MKGLTARAELVEINAYLDLGIQNELQDPVDVGLNTLRSVRERCRHYFESTSQFQDHILTGITEVRVERLAAV